MRFFLILLVFVLAISSVSADIETLNADVNLNDMSEQKRVIAQQFAQQLNKAAFCAFLESRLSGHDSAHSLVSLLNDYADVFGDSRCGNLGEGCANFDRNIRRVKGIENRLQEILQVRLHATNSRASESIDFSKVLVAYEPKGQETEWKHIEAFDCDGTAHQLSVKEAPSRPVLIVELNSKADMRAGLSLLNDELRKAGLQPQKRTQNRAGLETGKLDYIRVNDDKEPWILGDAEMYLLVNGIDTEAQKASIISQEMPYLDKDDKDYFPNQVIVVWGNYRYRACNINVFEHDDNTNYKDIALKLIDVVGQISTEYKALFDLASEIIKAMPSNWFSNDDDYVDVFYTMENKEYKNYQGASRNAKITLRPYIIPEVK
ncbi:DUF3103 family protein [Candidatus Uabimicrobium amorphum]|uniref:DUF3103 domain-containing protein n=1 Tax=Uabimicrobium amorphum TaxID=2596890 RepID=A0A5S9F5V2_UABAM|nr:DUF3103 family protein [Candidatus Uabimicrobium amorphum]BBM85662.1 hypothetical protein UABAM_04036 [Candidatus Uabimicrobium amorphum]